jgi:ubiquinone/menaquinone biosynthesis C-methylase UbiE
MNESDIQSFWEKFPCGDSQVGGLERFSADYNDFFNQYDAYRYDKESHILRCLDRLEFAGKELLEIGLGQGADSEQLIRRGANWSGLDLTPESVSRVQTRLDLRGLDYQAVKQGSVLSIPYDSKCFDIVFSHGVLHHVPQILAAQREIHRVLKPDGELIVMVYAKYSLNYLLSISTLRRVGLLALALGNIRIDGIYDSHLENAKSMGLFRYLSMKNFIHRNTDGPLNPYSKVYSLTDIKRDFPDFRIVRSYKQFMHAPPLPVHWLPLQRILGWHLWVHLAPR